MLSTQNGMTIHRVESLNYNPSIDSDKQNGRFWVVGQHHVKAIQYSKPDSDFIDIFYDNNELVVIPVNQYNVYLTPDENNKAIMRMFNTEMNEL